MDPIELLKSAAEAIDIYLSNQQINSFMQYKEFLLEWNQKINLTAITEEKQILIKHFVDSMTCAKFVKTGAEIIDVGTGAGFPGIPLKILMGDKIKVTLLDSLNKRIKYLNTVIEELKLSGINAIHARAEDAAKNKLHREKYDLCVSRAVASMPVLLELGLPFVKIGGTMLCMKGSNVEEEIEQSLKALDVMGGRLEKVCKTTLPKSDIVHTIVLIEKVRKTPVDYPRKAGKPEKQPII